jgi:phosphoglucomutase
MAKAISFVIILSPYQTNQVVSVHRKQSDIKYHKVYSSCAEAKCGCDCRTYEEQYCHIRTTHNTYRTNGVDKTSDVGDVKFIRAVKIEICLDFLNHYTTPYILQIINTINPTISRKEKTEKNIDSLLLYSFA